MGNARNGQRESWRDQTKREFPDEWVRAVNQHGGFGKWKYALSLHLADVKEIVQRAIVS